MSHRQAGKDFDMVVVGAGVGGVAALLALKPWFPKASILGGLLASLFFVNTVSFMITTPASVKHLPVAFPSYPPTDSS